MFQKSETMKELAIALLKAQKEISKAYKTATNPFFKSSYADLTSVISAVKEPLNNNGIAFLQAIDATEGGQPVIETILLHESGQYLSSRTPVFCSKPNDPQAFGSGVTYSKRYALQAMMGLPTADDDAEAAMSRNKKPPAKPKPKAQPPTGERPPVPKEGVDIITQAMFNYETEHSDEIAKGFFLDPDAFRDAIWREFSQWPTNKESVPKILAAIKFGDVVKEEKK